MAVREYNRLYLHIVLRPSKESAVAGHLLCAEAARLITETCEHTEVALIASAILFDHIHLLMLFPSEEPPQSWVRKFKAGFTKRFNTHAKATGTVGFSWSPGYRVYSISPNRLPKVEAYLRKQEAFHRNLSFEEEMQQLEMTCEESLQVMERQMQFGAKR